MAEEKTPFWILLCLVFREHNEKHLMSWIQWVFPTLYWSLSRGGTVLISGSSMQAWFWQSLLCFSFGGGHDDQCLRMLSWYLVLLLERGYNFLLWLVSIGTRLTNNVHGPILEDKLIWIYEFTWNSCLPFLWYFRHMDGLNLRVWSCSLVRKSNVICRP